MARITPLTPKEIRKAAAAQLAARLVTTYPTIQVFQRGPARPLQRDEVPALNVWSEGGESSGRSMHTADLETTDRFMVVGQVVVPEGSDFDDLDEALLDAVDDMEEAIKTALLTSRLFIATFEQVAGITTRKHFPFEGEDVRGAIEIEFRFQRGECYTPDAEPGSPDGDLLRVDVDEVVGSETLELTLTAFESWVTDTGDRLVTDTGDGILLEVA